MSQNRFEENSPDAEGAVNGFLDCIAYLMAKRWLKDQRTEDEKSSKRRKSSEVNDEQK
ncbi:hypothetical protein CA11_52800 [Gimesia maris]|uniref:hypothetical protein n=1 Tax=Gimesia maris TaxID=122 RepID=UPI00118D4DE6|nr:hypothetical protein [Gimesia maris]QDU17438.1 hypothetical protein CA11_52800 [Gimesia maris]